MIVINALDKKHFKNYKISDTVNLPYTSFPKKIDKKHKLVKDFLLSVINKYPKIKTEYDENVISIENIPIITYCANSGCDASKKLVDEFDKAGFHNVLEWKEGYDGYKKNITLFEKFIRAWGTLAYHEISLLLGLGVVILLGYAQGNQFGIWTFTVLYFARIFAKLNLFLGVPHINAEFIPEALSHLKSYFKISKLNWFFSVSVTLLTLTTVFWVERLFAVQNSHEVVGFSLLFAISLMALLEHWFMVLSIPDARLWRWMLPKTKTKQDYINGDYNGL